MNTREGEPQNAARWRSRALFNSPEDEEALRTMRDDNTENWRRIDNQPAADITTEKSQRMQEREKFESICAAY